MANAFGLEQRICDAEAKCLSSGAPLPEARAEQKKFTGGKTTIIILSNVDDEGKDKADMLFAEVQKAVEMSGKNISVEVVTDKEQIAAYNVRRLPALVINGSIVSQGILSIANDIVEEIEYLM